MPEPKLELLIRKPGHSGDDFRIMEVPSRQVYAGYRPARIAPGEYESAQEVSPLDGRKNFMLKAKGSQKYLSLNEREFFIWELMDGSRSIKEIAAEYFFNYGGLDLDTIKHLLARLREAGLVEFVPSSRLRVAIDRSTNPVARFFKMLLDKLEFRIEDADGWVSSLYDKGGYMLVSRPAMLLYIALSALGIAAFGRFEGVAKFPYRIFLAHPFIMVAAVILLLYPVAAVHELFHALACKRYGRKVYAFGLTFWDGFYPSVYTDVSDIYMAPRLQRIYVSLAGPLSTTALAAMFFFPVAVHPGASWAEPLYEMGRFTLLLAVIALYPFQFIKMDGYYLLSDLLGIPGLRAKSFKLIGNLPGFISAKKTFTARDVIMLAYFALSFASTVAFVLYFFL